MTGYWFIAIILATWVGGGFIIDALADSGTISEGWLFIWIFGGWLPAAFVAGAVERVMKD